MIEADIIEASGRADERWSTAQPTPALTFTMLLTFGKNAHDIAYHSLVWLEMA